MVYDVNEGVLYLSAAAPSDKDRANVVLTVSKDAQGENWAAFSGGRSIAWPETADMPLKNC